ncbi:MAG: hypothetical protein J0L76_12540, partial [Rhodobacterales bacterium]|nr:hypothetical protein [Rhodobacterales bacterium]
IGLGTQLAALSMLAFAPQAWLVVAWVMASQALSGIAKDMPFPLGLFVFAPSARCPGARSG